MLGTAPSATAGSRPRAVPREDLGPAVDRVRRTLGEAVETLPAELARVVQRAYFEARPRPLDEALPRLERRAIRLLRHPRLLRPAAAALTDATAALWAAIEGPEGALLRRDLRRAWAILPGPVHLAIRCRHHTFFSWLETVARKAGTGWYPTSCDEGAVEATTRALRRPGRRLPAPLPLLAELLGQDPELLALCAALCPRTTLKEGYVLHSPLRPRELRAARYHWLLTQRFPRASADADTLRREYLSTYGDDPHSFRDQQLTLSGVPHLVLKLGDLGWAALGEAPGPRAAQRSRSLLAQGTRKFRRRGTDEDAAPAWLSETMVAKPIWRYWEIVACLQERADAGAYRTTLGPLLQDEDLFVRLAPSVYGLRSVWNDRDPEFEAPDELLTRKDCLRYVVARHASEPLGAYPFWTSAMERKWCLWGEHHLDRRLFESLLSVAAPEQWPAPEAERARWARLKQLWGWYRLVRKPVSKRGSPPPPLGHLLPVAHHALDVGSVGWVRANRLLGQELLDGRIAGVLALLVAAGALGPTDDWQLLHEAGPELGGLVALLSDELHRTGALHWEGAAGQKLLDALAGNPTPDHGWVQGSRVRLIVRVLRGETLETGAESAEGTQRQLQLPFGEP